MNNNKLNEKIERLKESKGLSLKELMIRECPHCYDEEFFTDNYGKGKDKGAFGNIIQDRYFGIVRNSYKGADFIQQSIELKCTGLAWNSKSKKYSAKERLILSLINYDELPKQSFEDIIEKCRNMFIVFYIYEEDTKFYNWKIADCGYFNFDNLHEDKKKIIINDFNIIKEKVVQCRAEDIHGHDTKLLEACQKGESKAKSQIVQKNGVKAMQRAFAFKNALLTEIYESIKV